jgi:trk system potassium uptake protein TrkA
MKRFAVIGLGRFGKKLAIALSMSSAEVIALDRDRAVIDQIRDQVSHAVRLDATDEDALVSQGVGKVDVAIVSIGQGGQAFESAVLAVVNLKAMGVEKIYARAQNPIAGQVLAAVGATEVIYPEVESAQRWGYKLIAPHVSDKIDFAPGYGLASVTAPPSFHKKTVMDLQLRQKYNLNLVAIKQSEEGAGKKEPRDMISVPMPNTVVYQGDVLMIAGSDVDLSRLPQE